MTADVHCAAHSGVVTRLETIERRLEGAAKSREKLYQRADTIEDLLRDHLVATREERRWRRLMLPMLVGLVAGGGGAATMAALIKAAVSVFGGGE